MRKLAWSMAVVALVGCASGAEEKPDETTAQELESEPAAAPSYVVLSRLRPLHLAPDSDSPSLVYRTPDEQSAREAEMARERDAIAERLEKAAERDAKREEKRAKRVKKRMRRLRGERREAYREKEQERQAKRERDAAEDAISRELDWVRDHAGEAGHEHLFVAQFVEERGDWVAVKPITPNTPRCYDGAATRLQSVDATLWVQRSDLLRVVTERVRVPVAQGTEVILASGIATDGQRTYVDGFELGLDIPDSAVGDRFEVVRGFEAPYTETVFSPLAFQKGWLRLAKEAPLPFNPWHPLHVTATLYVGDRFYATTQTPCAEYTLRTIEEALEPVGKRGAMRLGGSESGEIKPPFARAGASLFGPDGQLIGTARGDLALVDEWEGPADLRCWHYEIWSGDEGRRRLPVCVKPDDFQSLNLTDGL